MTADGAGDPARKQSGGFTLAELLTVLGLVALLLSLLLPVAGKVRAAANATACLSNLRQMGAAWTMYMVESNGRLMHYAWYPPDAQTTAWDLYWPAVLDAHQVRGSTLLCPSASEPSDNEAIGGYGNATRAWTGRFASDATVVRLNDVTYRDSSYGYNRFLTTGGGFEPDIRACRISSARCISDVPVFLDCAALDVRPLNGAENSPPESPPNLRGDRITMYTPDHWNFLLARHGRGINVFMADGSARWTRLEDMYSLSWRSDWVRYRLNLPAR